MQPPGENLMSTNHPVIAVTGSSGAGTSTVKTAVEHILTREHLNAYSGMTVKPVVGRSDPTCITNRKPPHTNKSPAPSPLGKTSQKRRICSSTRDCTAAWLTAQSTLHSMWTCSWEWCPSSTSNGFRKFIVILRLSLIHN